MIISFVRSEVVGSCDGGFGLLIRLPNGEEKVFDSLTFDRLSIEQLSDRINRLGVSEAHLYEIIEDFL